MYFFLQALYHCKCWQCPLIKCNKIDYFTLKCVNESIKWFMHSAGNQVKSHVWITHANTITSDMVSKWSS